MDEQEKVNALRSELKLIKNADIYKFTKIAIENIPDYFFSISASSTGKHHPQYAQGEGGLLRHTRGAVKIANSSFQIEMFNHYTQRERDIIFASLILHDTVKRGENEEEGGKEHTQFLHPLYATKRIRENENLKGILPYEDFKLILQNIESHMGQWNTDTWGEYDEVLPKPVTNMQKFVHYMDYLSSRNFIEVTFSEG